MKNISDRLALAIKNSGHSKGALAEHIGVPQSSVSRWLSGSEPRSDRLSEIAKFLSVDVKWLMTGEGSAESETLRKNAESSANPKDHGIGESACQVREDSPPYGAGMPEMRLREVSERDAEMMLAFKKIREGLELLEEMMKKGRR